MGWEAVGRGAGLGAAVAGVVAIGATVGMLAEKAWVGRLIGPADDGEPYGALRGRVVPVTADDGLQLYVEVDEPPAPAAGLTIVFCHGFALTLDAWHYQRRDLRSLGRLVLWDQRSHGRSQRAARDQGIADSLTVPQLGRDLYAVLQAVAPTGPVVLVGHSMGGMTIMALAAEHPELFGDRIRGVALLATSSGGMDEVPFGLPAPAARVVHKVLPDAAAALARRPALVDRSRERGSDLGLVATRMYSFASPVPASMARFVADMNNATPIDVVADFLPAIDDHDQRAALEPLQQCEVVVIAGGADLLIPQQHSREIVTAVPGAEFVVLDDTGHMLLLERWAEVNAQLRDLVRRVRANLPATAADGAAAGDEPGPGSRR
ncbi:MAG: alpha/beta hydrolase [Actinomycetota bacterium]|nr:MAG: alpha/beta hydrolase [Actinomycetota bacterium]